MHKVILDCDNTLGLPFKEIDDGLALLYLLGRPDIEIMGVTTVFGNGSMVQSYEQTRQLFHAFGRDDITIYRGAEKAGDTTTEAARFLAEMCIAHPGEISMIATGPLSNLLSAQKFNGDFFSNLKQIVCMGGYLEPLRIGWRDVAELNLSADAKASWAVFNSLCPVTVMSAQLCLQVSFGWRDFRRVSFLDKNLRLAIRNWLIAFGLFCATDRFYLWDLLPTVYISYPGLFEQRQVIIHSTVEDLHHGWLVVGAESRNQGKINLPSNVTDIEKFKTIMFDAWQNAIMRK